MKILLTGGGTGGHIKPLLAVADELKRSQPDVHIIYVGERDGRFAHMLEGNLSIDEVHTIYAGKFRRYHGESWLRRLFDVQTNLANIRDLFYFLIGSVQSVFLMRQLKPDVVLLKGGFVGVPIGIAAALWKIKFVTHDSDTLPGLANKLVARWATFHATAGPAEYYPSYPKRSVKHVGVLVSEQHARVTPENQAACKREIGIPTDAIVLLITGGSNGAEKINKAIRKLVPDLLKDFPKLSIVHQVGKGKDGIYKDLVHSRLQVHELLHPMHIYTGASDVVVTRAGANTIAELGVQGRACIVIPNPLLTGGHQLKNAENLEKQGAIKVVDETTLTPVPDALHTVIHELLADSAARDLLGEHLHAATIPDATHKLSVILLDLAKK